MLSASFFASDLIVGGLSPIFDPNLINLLEPLIIVQNQNGVVSVYYCLKKLSPMSETVGYIKYSGVEAKRTKLLWNTCHWTSLYFVGYW